ncbi:MAG TPA: trypsin-like peptidase domain-containing protein [Acidimicrobiia bacterium]|nr:trypsin-like peptidase domain-containing protein [Acidimicrobiia bacterium]
MSSEDTTHGAFPASSEAAGAPSSETVQSPIATQDPAPQPATAEPVEPAGALPAATTGPPPARPPAQPPVKRSSGRVSPWLIGLIALLLVVGSSAATYLITTIDDQPEVSADGTPAPGADDETQAEGVAPDELVPGEEPVADAAAVILPSVVQIQTGSGPNSGVGSGVIYDSNGLILTAAHVVSGQETVTVRFADGEQVEGTVVGGTAGADVAVVQVDRTGLPAAELALDDDPEVGQMAIAVGSPWGLQGTVTAGIISAVDQAIPQGGSARAVLQTDAAINPGNSGGPLVDREGRVIGINVSIFSLSGANDGVGFAVPIDIAHDIAERVVAGEEIQSAYLGVSLGVVETGQAGALVEEVTPGTGAAEAGLQPGDLVVSIDGVPVQSGGDLAAQIQTHQPGDSVDLEVVRDGAPSTISVTLGERPVNLG